MATAPAARRQSIGTDPTDRQLLERFVHDGEQRAFTALVRRHGSVVLAVCRQVLRHDQDAEDVSQGTFLVLARKAGRVAWQPSVRNWLCAVAYRLALNARAPRETASSIADSDTLLASSHPIPVAEVEEREIREIIHEELRRLPETYREPIILCYLEGKTNREAARLLGWPHGSMARRLARARRLLRDRLIQRGLIITAVLIALAWLGWLSVADRNRDGNTTAVAQLMSEFKQPRVGGIDSETTIRRLAEGNRQIEPAALREVANHAAEVGTALQSRELGSRGSAWRGYAEEMRRSAVALAEAAEQKDDPGVVLAARRLSASCVSCHKAFRR